MHLLTVAVSVERIAHLACLGPVLLLLFFVNFFFGIKYINGRFGATPYGVTLQDQCLISLNRLFKKRNTKFE